MMNMFLKFTVFLALLAQLGCSTLGGSSFDLRPFQEVTLSNGLKVIYVEDSSLPYFSLNLMIDAGASADNKENSGVANLVSELLQKGTKKKSAIELADELDFIGANFGVSVGSDYTQISASSLSFHQDKLLSLFSEIVTEPSFRKSEVSRVRKNIQARLKKLVDNPKGYASRAFSKHLYGDHPYSNSVLGTQKGISSIKQKHINRYFLRHYRPNKSILAVVGKFDDSTRRNVEKAFSRWQPRESEVLNLGGFPEIKGRELLLVNKPGSVQAQVRLGMPGIRRKNDDYLALRVANTILGGGFASRLNDQIRDNLGLTYYVGSGFDARKFQGPFAVSTFTRNAKVRKIIDETLSILEKFYSEGVSEKEVEQAKGLIKGRFPRSIETAERLAFNLVYLKYHDLPESYLSDFIENIDSMSASDVNRAIKKYFNPENIKILVFGDAKPIKKQLKGLGKLKIVGYEKFQ